MLLDHDGLRAGKVGRSARKLGSACTTHEERPQQQPHTPRTACRLEATSLRAARLCDPRAQLPLVTLLPRCPFRSKLDERHGQLHQLHNQEHSASPRLWRGRRRRGSCDQNWLESAIEHAWNPGSNITRIRSRTCCEPQIRPRLESENQEE